MILLNTDDFNMNKNRVHWQLVIILLIQVFTGLALVALGLEIYLELILCLVIGMAMYLLPCCVVKKKSIVLGTPDHQVKRQAFTKVKTISKQQLRPYGKEIAELILVKAEAVPKAKRQSFIFIRNARFANKTDSCLFEN